MPPKPKYTKDEIINAAYEMVRQLGEESLSARNLAARLGCSTAPLFTAFSSVEELMGRVKEKAYALYMEYIERGLSMTPAFKGSGLMYIKYAKDEPKLFKMLFMGKGAETEATHYMPAGADEPLVRGAVEQRYSMDTESARWLYNHLSVYVHGLAVMFAEGRCVFSDEDVDRMLSEVFLALKKEVERNEKDN